MAITNQTIGKKLMEARKKNKLSQAVVAEKIKVHRTAIVKIENGTRNISAIELKNLARLYERCPSEFLEEETLNDFETINKTNLRKQYSQILNTLNGIKRLSDSLNSQIQAATIFLEE